MRPEFDALTKHYFGILANLQPPKREVGRRVVSLNADMASFQPLPFPGVWIRLLARRPNQQPGSRPPNNRFAAHEQQVLP